MRQTRIGLGKTLEDVHSSLRIRRVYIKAIESGNYSALPGPPFGIGYLKSYARYLDLDCAEIVRRYHQEINIDPDPDDTELTAPPHPRHRPGRFILLLSAALVVATYTGWYYLSGQPEKNVSRPVDPLPEYLADYVTEAGGDQPEFDQGDLIQAPETTPTDAVTDAVEPPDVETVPSSTLQPVLTPIPPMEEILQESTISDVGTPADSAASRDSRLTLTALEDSWMRIYDSNGDIVVTHMLAPGTSYHVPNRDGLRLEVGNAGTLTYQIDGGKAHLVGDYGVVLSDFPLDVELLLQRDR